MGEVYRARDERLGRDVALKVLPVSVAQDPERLARFDREAKLLAALSHPNIATLFALDRIGGQTVLAMELAAGDDLTARISRGPMAILDALPIAKQVALALEAAHEKGIIHRDLKPANIKVDADGAVKVLDFGLAKALGADGATDSTAAMNSPTLTAQATMAGIILGTAAYMSPEQARGRAADKRADIWSFGVVVFEMLTGGRLFHGETISDTIAAVLRQDVDWKLLPPDTPPALRQLLRRCLERDRKNRLHDIADARIALDEIGRGDSGDVSAAPVIAAKRRLPASIWVALALASLGLGAFAEHTFWPSAEVPAPARLTRFVVAAPPGVTGIDSPAMPPDGTFVVFEGVSGGQQRLFVQRFDEVAARVLDKTEGASQPFISFDGRWIGFRRNNRMERVPIEGGDPITIAETTSSAPGATWGPDGTIIYAQTWLSGLMAVPFDHGTPRALTTLDAAKGEKGHYWPRFLPGGKGVLFTAWPAGSGLNDAKIAVLDLASGKFRELLPGAFASYAPPGYLVFYHAGAYHAVAFDLATMTTSGGPARVIDDAQGLVPDGGYTTAVAISESGTLAYRPGQLFPQRAVALARPDGTLERLSFPSRAFQGCNLSTDGRRLACTVVEAGQYAIRILDLERGTEELLEAPGGNQAPVWDSDGKRLAFVSMRKGDFDIYAKDTTSNAPPAVLLATERDEMPSDWAPDGRLAIQQSDPDGIYRIKLFDPAHPDQTRRLTEKGASSGTVSPDGKWITYEASSGGRSEVYVTALTGDRAPILVSKGGGVSPQWSRRTHEVFYARHPEILAATYQVDGDRFRVVSERVVMKLANAGDGTANGFILAPDGRILIFPPTADPVPPQLRIVINWPQEIARRLAGGK
jgi:serine/threonine-protein kinase